MSNKTALFIDFGDICTEYNTVYLDRDNEDRETKACMKGVLDYLTPRFETLMERFGLVLYRPNEGKALRLEQMINKRFCFYSLEKAITLQSYLLTPKNAPKFSTVLAYLEGEDDGVLIQNNEDGEGISLVCKRNTPLFEALKERFEIAQPVGFESIRTI